MNLQTLRRWHWMMIGLVAGLAVGAGRILSAADERIGGAGFVNQSVFENDLRVPPLAGKPYVKGIVLHRAQTFANLDIVSFWGMDPATGEYRQFRLVAPRPYRPLAARIVPAANYNVAEFLRDAAATNPAIAFQNAWWDAPAIAICLWALLGAVVIGGIWPTVLDLIYGRNRTPREEYDLNRFGKYAELKTNSAVTANDTQRLAELEAEMSRALANSKDEPSTSVATATAPVKELEAAPLEDSAAAISEEEKKYAGQFYPVEKHAPHGFTLVELLVVIGIIAILISILMPALRLVRKQSETVTCAAHLRQVGMALTLYAGANRGWLPQWSGWHCWPPRSDDPEGPAWTVELIPYIGNPDSPVYNCPSFPGPQRCRNYFLEAQWSGRSGRDAMKLSDVTMTSRFVLGGDKTNPALYPPPIGSALCDDADPDDYGPVGALLWPWGGGFYMHSRGNNVLFDDCHVAVFSRYDRSAMTFNPHAMEDWQDVTPD